MAKILWTDVAAHFVGDSSSALREVVVPDVGLAEWQRFLDRIRASSWSVQYWRDGVPASLPPKVEDIFVAASAHSSAVQINWDGLEVDVWFFDERVVHCSVGASTVTSQADLDRLLTFTRFVGGACGQAVYVTYEGGEDDPPRSAFLVYEPSDDSFRTVELPSLGDGPILGDGTRLILLEDRDALRVLLRQQAEWEDSPSQLDEIDAMLEAVTTYVLSEQLDWNRRRSPTERWRVEIRCVTQPPPATAETLERARESIRAQGGDLVIKPPEASAGLFD